MTFEITEAKPLLDLDDIEISRLRTIYETEKLAYSFGYEKETATKNKKLINWIVSALLKFAPRNSVRRARLRRFWKFTPKYIKVIVLQSDGWLSTTKEHFGLSTSFNIDRGFGLRTSGLPLVSIIIPVYNNYQLTLQCLRALQINRDITPFEVIVINDASVDFTKLALANIRGIRVIDLQYNQGYLRATNLGISAARGKYVALLNNDTIPISGWLDRLVDELENDSKIGIAGAKLLYPNMRLQELGSQIFNDGSGWNLGKYTDFFSPEHSFTREVDYVSAAAILVRADLLSQTNGFDELYVPAYYEDVDLAMQVRKLGSKVVAVHDSFVIHIEGGSHGTNTQQNVKQHQDINKAKFTEKWAVELASHWSPDEGPRLEARRNSKGIVVIYDSQFPQASRDAGSQRAIQVVKNLSNLGFHVVYFSPDKSVSIIDIVQFRDLGIEIQTNHDTLIESLRVRSNRVRGVWIQRISVANSFFDIIRKKFPNIPIVFDTVDLVSSRISKEKIGGIKSEMKFKEAIRLENKFTSQSQLTLTVSEDEKILLQSRVPSAKIKTLWMPFETLQNVQENNKLSNTGLFVGNFRHMPNKVSLIWFVKNVLPLILVKNKDFVLTVVGTGLTSSEITEINVEGVTFLGFVDNLANAYENAKVVVIPLQYGAGIKGKTCEALSHGKAIVSTSYGVEGLNLQDGVEYLLAESAENFAVEISRVLSDEKLRYELSRSALKYANANLTAEAFTKKITEIARLFE